jgi:hypothetical protein
LAGVLIAKVVYVALEILVIFFFEFAKVKIYFVKISRKGDIIIIICKGLLPIAARGPAGAGHQRMRVAIAKFPKVRLCES